MPPLNCWISEVTEETWEGAARWGQPPAVAEFFFSIEMLCFLGCLDQGGIFWFLAMLLWCPWF